MEIAEQLSTLLGQPINQNRENVSVRCPLHDDRVASMSINLRKGVWYCWGCGRGGGLRALAQLLGGELDQVDLVLMSARNQEPEPEPVDFSDKLQPLSSVTALDYAWTQYANRKQLNDDVAEYFDIRHDRSTLVMPYYDGDSVVALRYLSYSGKKWYESGSERTIYNINRIRGARYVVLAEGESDTHTIYNWYAHDNNHSKLPGVVVGGVPGANNSREKWEVWSLDLMWAEKVWIAFDNDDAGNKGADRAIDVLGSTAERLAPPEEYNDWSDAIIAGHNPVLEA